VTQPSDIAIRTDGLVRTFDTFVAIDTKRG
jgi:hypothetical protein